MVDQFDRLYRDKLHKLPAWSAWTGMIDQLDDKVGGAFLGTVDLHDTNRRSIRLLRSMRIWRRSRGPRNYEKKKPDVLSPSGRVFSKWPRNESTTKFYKISLSNNRSRAALPLA